MRHVAVGSYELLGQLGAGGMGLVCRAKHRATGRIVSLKMLRGGRYATAAELRRCHRESNVVMQLDHPNKVKVVTVDERDGHGNIADVAKLPAEPFTIWNVNLGTPREPTWISSAT